MERHWQTLARSRRLATFVSLVLLAFALAASLWFANDSNSGNFWDWLPHVADFIWWLYPNIWPDVWRALFNLATPNADGTFATDFPDGRVYVWGNFYIPGYFYLLAQTLNVALLCTLIGFAFGFPLCFLAACNATPNGFLRFAIRRGLEFMRAFPVIVIAVLFASFLSIGPVPAIIAVSAHIVGALGKLFFEVVENADARPVEGLRSVGGSWVQQIRYGLVPQVLPIFLSYALLRLEVNARESTIVGAVGGGSIDQELLLAIKRGYGTKTVEMIIFIFLTILAIDRFSGYVRRRLVGEQAFVLSGVAA